VPALILGVRGPAGRRLIGTPTPRLPIATAAPWSRWTRTLLGCGVGEPPASLTPPHGPRLHHPTGRDPRQCRPCVRI